MLKIGDRVKFLSNTGVGVITKIEKDVVWVDVEDGFEIPSDISDIVAVSKEQELDAIERIGAGDVRPGSRKGKAQPKKEKEVKKDREAYKRYGKVSLIDDSEMEEDEEIIDIHEIRERYTRNLIAMQKREKEIEQEEQQRIKNSQSVIKSGDVIIKESPKEEVKDIEQNTQPKEGNKSLSSFEELAEKIKGDKKTIGSVTKKKKVAPKEIDTIDLHATEILESTQGMSSGEIITAQLARFTISLDTHIKSNKHGKIVYIHGVGKGRLRYEIERKLKSSYPVLSFQDASFKEYGYGAILIIY